MRKPRAIVIDDEVCIRDMLKTFLSRRGFDVIAHETPVMCPVYSDNSETCNEKQKCADVFITDLTMPGLNGIDLIEKQKKNGCKINARNKAIISGNIDTHTVEMVCNTGSVCFSKPFRLSEIAGWLKECQEGIDLNDPLENIERRGEKRRPSSGERKISPVIDAHTVLSGKVKNESDSGICIELQEEILPGCAVLVKSAVPESSPRATVRWVRSNGDGYIAGLLFD